MKRSFRVTALIMMLGLATTSLIANANEVDINKCITAGEVNRTQKQAGSNFIVGFVASYAVVSLLAAIIVFVPRLGSHQISAPTTQA